MLKITVFINQVSAERLWDIEKPIPPVQISTNLNLIAVEERREDLLEVPFVFTINYNPGVAQISLKGKAQLSGEKEELKRVHKDYADKKPPPQTVIQSVSNVAFLESLLITRTLNIPPPIPLPQIPTETQTENKKSEPSYRT